MVKLEALELKHKIAGVKHVMSVSDFDFRGNT